MKNSHQTTEELVTEVSLLLTILEAVITEKRRTLQIDRLQTLKEIAGGVAHEVNQPLTSILGLTELLLREKPLDAGLREDVELIREEGIRISKIVKNMLTLKRYATTPYTENVQVVDFNASSSERSPDVEKEPPYTHIRPINAPELQRTLEPLLGEQAEKVVDCVQWWVQAPEPVRQALRNLCVGWA